MPSINPFVSDKDIRAALVQSFGLPFCIETYDDVCAAVGVATIDNSSIHGWIGSHVESTDFETVPGHHESY